MILAEEYAERRLRLLEDIRPGIALIFSNSECTRSRDTHFRFRQSSDMTYFLGFEEPECALLLVAGEEATSDSSLLFLRPRDLLREQWEGRRLGIEMAPTQLGIGQAFDIKELPRRLAEAAYGSEKIVFPFDATEEQHALVRTATRGAQAAARRGGIAPTEWVDLARYSSEYRLIKSEAEQQMMRSAVRLSAEAHVAMMKHCLPGMNEYELQAVAEAHFLRGGASGPAYTSIVGGGVNATILHYIENRKTLHDGELVLIDAGAELGGYAGDITRTFPVGKTFTAPQKDVYQLVLDAQKAAISMVKPGVSQDAIHRRVTEILTDGLIQLRIIRTTAELARKKELFKAYYMHKTGHYLGLDVHDVGNYFVGKQPRPLEAGMVITIEPGLYFPEQLAEVPELAGIGIRIEDDILVTADGYENLSISAPKEVSELEELRGMAFATRIGP